MNMQDGLQTKLDNDFYVGNLATDLVDYTLQICNKPPDKPPRFPKIMYESYVTQIVNLTLRIHQNICEANALRAKEYKRSEFQYLSLGECASLEKLIHIALKRGWISEKQYINWQRKICDLHFKILKWIGQM